MDNKKIKKYERITKITGILIGLIVILGTSYAVFKTVTRSEETNTISAGKLDVQIENEQNEITIEKAYPIRDKEGLKQSPYTFSIVNKGSINAEYDLYIEIEENTTLPTDVVRYYLTVEEEGEEKIVTEQARLIAQEEKIEREVKSLYKIDTKYLDTTKTNKYKLYLWIDYEATKEQASNKYFEARVVVDAVQIYDKNRLVKHVDVSESGDGSIQAYMYADGTVYIKGKGTLASDLSDTVVYEKEGIVDNYKKVLIEIGCNEEEVKAITSMKELEAYVEEQANNDESFYEKIEIAQNKEIITEMGYDASSITNYESLYAWLIEQGIMDEEGNYTEEGKILLEEFESRVNEKYDYEPIPAKKIILEDGIENIPSGLFTYNEDITEVRIPASVKRIDDRAFEGCSGLKEITIPNSVTSIGNSAFQSCTSLTKIVLSKNIEEIGEYAFAYCNSLTTIDIPNSVTSIGNNAFQSCTSLTTIEIPERVTSIGNSAFYNCTGIKKLTIDGTKNYGDLRMSNVEELVITGTGNMYNYSSSSNVPWNSSRSSIKKVTISDTITSIGSYVFYWCTSLTNITIPNSVTSIGSNAFYNCTGIKKLTIDGTKNYGDLKISTIEELEITGTGNMYNYSSSSNVPWNSSRSSIKKVTISDTITSIGSYAFYNCTSLTTIDNPDSVTSIEDYAFYWCTSLTSIDIPASVTSIGSSAFNLVGNINYNGSLSGTFGARARNGYVEGDYVYTDSSKTRLAAYCGKGSVVNIPNSVISIGHDAFYNCTNLTTIEIPNSVTSIGNYAFSNCTSLIQINVDENNENYVSIDGVLFNKEQTTIIKYPEGKKETSYTMPNTVTQIANFAFKDCKNLEKLEIPTSVTRIEFYAFYSCTNIKEITIPNSVEYVGVRAFLNWTSSQTIHIDNTEAYVNANWDSYWKSICYAQINYLRS